MKIFLRQLLFFLSCLVITYPVFLLIFGYFIPQLFKPNINYQIGAYGHMFSRIKEVKNQKENLDILFFGSSHAYRGFDTRNFDNLKTFNLGSSSQTPIQTQTLLHRYIDKLKPKTIIYEVYPGTFSADGTESSLDIIANDENDIYSLKMALKVKNIKVYNTLIYGLFSDLFGVNTSFSESYKKGEDRYIAGGFVERDMQYYKNVQSNRTKSADFNPKQISAFEENIDLIKERKIRLILIYAPITKSLYNSNSNNLYVDSVMGSYEVEYFNFNNILSLDDSLDFYDSHHLNQSGVKKFNHGILETIDFNK